MDYETKILLNKLVEAVDSPDWWAIGITVVNALMIVWLGWRQYNLQQRQVRQQEYELYRKLYVVIENVENLSGCLLNRIYEYFSLPLYGKNFLEHLLEQINLCDKQLNKSSIDFKFWTSYNEKEVEYYKELVCSMRLLVQFLQRMEQDKIIKFIDEYNNRAAANGSNNNYTMLIEELLKRVNDETYKKCLKNEIDMYIRTRNFVVKREYLEKIEKYCKVV